MFGIPSMPAGTAAKHTKWGAPTPASFSDPNSARIPRFYETLLGALRVVTQEEVDISEIVKKIQAKAEKVSGQFSADDRATTRGGASRAKVLIEEFVEEIMGYVYSICCEKPWYPMVSWTQTLLVLVEHTFKDYKLFVRMLKPKLVTCIEEAVFKWQEEERVTRAISDAIEVSGISESYKKKARQALMKAYDEAHFKAPYGTTTNESPELAVLQDFTKGWMSEFLTHGWSVLENGLAVEAFAGGKEAQTSTLACLFQHLMDPNVACMPYEIATEITSTLGGLPAAPWPFIDEAAAQIVSETAEANAKKRRMGY